MLAAADCASHYPEQIIYESSWADTTPNGISWLNLLTAEPIPEETEVTDISHTPVRHNSASSCSSSSIGSCYVVLEIQRPRSLTETSSTVGKDDEEDGEEEMEEEMEELHFAQACTNEPEIDCDQLAVSLTIEVPVEYRMFESLEEQTHEIEEHAEASQPVIHESCNEECTEQTRSLGRFTKRTATTPDMSNREQPRPAPSTAGETERSEGCRFTLDTPAPIENNPMAEAKNTVSHSNTSLDSIENKLAPSTPTAPRTTTTTTFSSLSTQRTSVAVPIQRSGPKMGTNTLTRTFAFDRACMEKYGQAPESTLRSIPVAPVTVPAVHKDIGLPPRRSNPSDTSVCAATAARQSHPAAEPCQANGIDAFEDIPPSPAAFDPQSLGRTSSVLCLMKKCARTVTSEYRLRDAQGNMHAEPTLLQVTYLDGRLPLRTNQTGELFRKTNTLSSSISSRLNKLGLPKMPSTQDLSSASASLGKSYRKRMLSRFRTLLESNGAQPAQPVPWQHKTITELFQERRQRP